MHRFEPHFTVMQAANVPTSTCAAKYLTQNVSACDCDFSYLSDVTVSLTYRTDSMLPIKRGKKDTNCLIDVQSAS